MSWQFPAWQVEVRETAAVREAGEVVAVMVAETQILGERVHLAIGRMMIYVVCDVVDGYAWVVYDEELVGLAWSELDSSLGTSHGFFEPVQQ